MKNRDKLIISVVAVLAIVVLVGGSTFAYWTWISNTDQQTAVNFSTPEDASGAGLSATIAGNGSATANNLKPTPCTNTSYAIVKTFTITYKNETEHAATITAKLSATSFTIRSSSYVPNSTKLQSLKWAVRSSAATDATTSSPNTCDASGTALKASGNFSSVTFSGTSGSNLPLQLGTFTISVPAGTAEKTDTFYLYIWLDYNYSHENQGSVNSDPMQGISVTTQWSGTYS